MHWWISLTWLTVWKIFNWTVFSIGLLVLKISRPPNGCLQYYSTLVGRITTFNFIPATGSNHLANQEWVYFHYKKLVDFNASNLLITLPLVKKSAMHICHAFARMKENKWLLWNLALQPNLFPRYSACVRRQNGYCCIQYQVTLSSVIRKSKAFINLDVGMYRHWLIMHVIN
jgi:hypothetical protein